MSADKDNNAWMAQLMLQGTNFLNVSGDNVALITWKAAENGDGTILRLQEIAGKAAKAQISLPKRNISSARLCSGVEANVRILPVEGNAIHLTFQPFEVLTVRVLSR